MDISSGKPNGKCMCETEGDQNFTYYTYVDLLGPLPEIILNPKVGKNKSLDLIITFKK